MLARLPIALSASLLGAALAAACSSGTKPAAETPAASPVPAIEAWRAKHEADYRRDFASIAGLFPLKEGVNTAGSAANNDIRLAESMPATVGRFVLAGEDVRFEPAPGAAVRLKDQPVTAPVSLK